MRTDSTTEDRDISTRTERFGRRAALASLALAIVATMILAPTSVPIAEAQQTIAFPLAAANCDVLFNLIDAEGPQFYNTYGTTQFYFRFTEWVWTGNGYREEIRKDVGWTAQGADYQAPHDGYYSVYVWLYTAQTGVVRLEVTHNTSLIGRLIFSNSSWCHIEKPK